MRALTLSRLNSINRKSIAAAGPRYSPALDASAPNLPIATLLSSIEALALSRQYSASLEALDKTLREEWGNGSRFGTIFRGARGSPTDLLRQLKYLREQRAGKSSSTLATISRLSERTTKVLGQKYERLRQRQQKLSRLRQTPPVEEHTKQEQAVEAELHRLRGLQNAISGIRSFVRSPDFSLVSKNRMFIRGEWGAGKTHFLCDVTRQRMGAKLPTLLLLAHRLPQGEKPLAGICKATRLAKDSGSLLRQLDRLGKKSGGRALLIIDGINEADRGAWRRSVVGLAREVCRYANVGLVLSCRSPFEHQIMGKAAWPLFVETSHQGFQDIEFDAQREFFTYYGVPHPHVPLLTPEFTRPLFLKILCLSFSGRTKTAKSRNLHEIASGQKGMTKIFEDFVCHVGAPIERDFKLSPKACWLILKGNAAGNGASLGIAGMMAANLRDYVTPDECRAVIAQSTGLTRPKDIENVMRRLVVEGLLTEDGAWDQGALKEVIRLPYQRFSDHLVCRHLLEKHLRGKNAKEIARNFYKNRPLGKIFSLAEYGNVYRMPGLASAIMLEFPERVKRTLPDEEREVVFYLPKHARRFAPLVPVFLEGLLWRAQSSFSKQTDHIVKVLLEQGNEYVKHDTLEALVGLASRAGHPYSAERLYVYLAGLSMPHRDLLWSEFLRGSASSSAIYRLLDWIDASVKTGMRPDTARLLMRLCALLLTSTHRPLRDRATRALVIMGDSHPAAQFELTIESLSFNDPYVGERMLAPSYGVLMRSWDFPSNALKSASSPFARALFDLIFEKNAPHATTHILAREYALGVIELARKLDHPCLGRRSLARLAPPFSRMKARIPLANRIRESHAKEADTAIMMDFGNYTIGRLVKDRSNYDSKHRGYRRVLRQIKWRILDLGYSKDRFFEIDRRIGEASFYRSRNAEGEKTDRYGKKYSWIAFFEVAGMLADKGTLPHYDEEGRLSDADIDPSFPEVARVWRPPLLPLFVGALKSSIAWAGCDRRPDYKHLLVRREVDGIEGPWVLLHGFVDEAASHDAREIFSFVRGLLVRDADVRRLRSKFNSIEYPGNRAIPDPGTEHYTFAGEVPWSTRFGRYYRRANGTAKPCETEAFEEHRYWAAKRRLNELSAKERREFARQRNQQRIIEALLRGRDRARGVVESRADDAPTPTDVVTLNRSKVIEGVKVELPVISFSFGGGQSTQNRLGSVDLASPAVCEALRLTSKGASIDLLNSSGHPATLYRRFPGKTDGGNSHLLYLRKDLLEKYLSRRGRKLVWLIWGERSFNYKFLEGLRDILQPVWQKHEHIHRRMVVWRFPVRPK